MPASKALSHSDFKEIVQGDQFGESIAENVRGQLTVEQIQRLALTCVHDQPKILQCSKDSILKAILDAARVGLDFGSGTVAQGYLVPYKGTCQFIPGYRGLRALAMRSGKLDSIDADIVFERDEFEIVKGTKPVLRHVPYLKGDRGPIIGAYGVAYFKASDQPQIEWMSKVDIDRIRASSASGGSEYSPWGQHYGEMARKTVIRRLCKHLPTSVDDREMEMALAMDDASEREWSPVRVDQHSGTAGLKAALKSPQGASTQASGDSTTSVMFEEEPKDV